jgi:hypothetical protein
MTRDLKSCFFGGGPVAVAAYRFRNRIEAPPDQDLL